MKTRFKLIEQSLWRKTGMSTKRVKTTRNTLETGKQDTNELHYSLRLYVAGLTPRSQEAIRNITAICEELLSGFYDLEVIDLYLNPSLARVEQIIAAPTLIKKWPLPLRKIIGNMSDKQKVLIGLNLRSG